MLGQSSVQGGGFAIQVPVEESLKLTALLNQALQALWQIAFTASTMPLAPLFAG